MDAALTLMLNVELFSNFERTVHYPFKNATFSKSQYILNINLSEKNAAREVKKKLSQVIKMAKIMDRCMMKIYVTCLVLSVKQELKIKISQIIYRDET